MMCYAFNIMIPNILISSNVFLGSSLNFSAHGGWGKEKNRKPAEKIAVGSEGEAGRRFAAAERSVSPFAQNGFAHFQTKGANTLTFGDLPEDERQIPFVFLIFYF